MTWSPDLPPSGDWSVQRGDDTRRITEGGTRRITEQGNVRIIERFVATWTAAPPASGTWT